jgi:hypothetical protein
MIDTDASESEWYGDHRTPREAPAYEWKRGISKDPDPPKDEAG